MKKMKKIEKIEKIISQNGTITAWAECTSIVISLEPKVFSTVLFPYVLGFTSSEKIYQAIPRYTSGFYMFTQSWQNKASEIGGAVIMICSSSRQSWVTPDHIEVKARPTFTWEIIDRENLAVGVLADRTKAWSSEA